MELNLNWVGTMAWGSFNQFRISSCQHGDKPLGSIKGRQLMSDLKDCTPPHEGTQEAYLDEGSVHR
jgi:hypothetical protein